MADEAFSVSFDPRSISEIAQLYGFGVLLSHEVQAAFREGGSLLVKSVQGAMHWENPSGDLERSIRPVHDSPYELQVGSDLPYARRRELGFSGRTDRLGRYYAKDDGAFYMKRGFEASQSHILASIENAAERALQRLQG